MQQVMEVLEAIELDLNRKDMVILGALLKAQSDSIGHVSFDSLREQLAKDEGEKRGKDSLVYRSLSWLDQVGLIQVDRSGHKHGYNSNVGLMHKVIEKAMKEKSSFLSKDLKALDSEIQMLSEIDFNALALDLISPVSGTKTAEKPSFAQGWQNILKLMDDKIYKGLKKNDIIRFTLEWYDRPEELERPRLDNIESMLRFGVEIRGLEHRRLDKKRIRRFVKYFENFQKGGYRVGFRLCPRENSTYQFVARNSEGIVLIVSENPLSATWLPKSANAELVNDAIQSFDRDYQSGLEISVLGV